MNKLILALRILWATVSIVGFTLLINFPLILLGWILIPIAAACKAYYAYDWHDGAGVPRVQHHFTWKFMWLWDNEEDGISNNSYTGEENMFKRIVEWSANRNPVNNLRHVPYLSLKINPAKVQFVGSDPVNTSYAKNPPRVEWFFAWHGLYSSFWIIFPWKENIYPFKPVLKRLWLGWKIYPNDQKGLLPGSYRLTGVTCCSQFKDA